MLYVKFDDFEDVSVMGNEKDHGRFIPIKDGNVDKCTWYSKGHIITTNRFFYILLDSAYYFKGNEENEESIFKHPFNCCNFSSFSF